ncbi:acyl carrier protein [Amycolatopsis sp. NPDC059021]|uniref:acyl carrier protein n=1 Tax=Amycolatopsis sp. NPDC059021 TaxID=3346704 RepID=UPI00366FF412
MTTANETIDAKAVEAELLQFLGERIKAPVTPDQDLFGAGLVSSMFAMQLVVHLEEAYDIEIVGPELTLDHFRSVQAMTALVLRLRESAGSDG